MVVNDGWSLVINTRGCYFYQWKLQLPSTASIHGPLDFDIQISRGPWSIALCDPFVKADLRLQFRTKCGLQLINLLRHYHNTLIPDRQRCWHYSDCFMVIILKLCAIEMVSQNQQAPFGLRDLSAKVISAKFP